MGLAFHLRSAHDELAGEGALLQTREQPCEIAAHLHGAIAERKAAFVARQLEPRFGKQARAHGI